MTTPKRYAYEFCKRWLATVPRADIKWIFGSLHVSTPAEDVESAIMTRIENAKLSRQDHGFTDSVVRQSLAYALLCHADNIRLYRAVMLGVG